MLGSGNYTYTPVEDWGNFPDEVILGDVAVIAIDANDQVYLFNRGHHPVIVLCQNGEVLRTWGHGIFHKSTWSLDRARPMYLSYR